MKEPRTIEGRWHIFGRGHAAHFGVLQYDPEEGLDLTVKIPKSTSFDTSLAASPPPIPSTICGYDQHDQPVTLFGCSSGGSKVSGGLAVYGVHAIYALLGRHFSTTWKKLKFSGAYATYSSLNRWIARPAFDHKMEPGGKITMTHTHPPDIVIPIDTNTDLTITTGGSTHVDYFSEFRLTQDHAMKFTFKGKPRNPRIIYGDYVLSLARLLTLFTGRRVYVDSVFFDARTKGRPGRVRVELLAGNSGVTNADRSTPHSAAVQFQEIKGAVATTVKEWFHNQQIYDSVLNLYFATLFVPNLYAPQQFLLLAQALEVYHNSNPKFSKSLQTRSKFRQRIRDILAKLPSTEQDWVKEGLHHANQKSLAQRLDDILSAHRTDVRKFISKPRRFADLIRHTRNYYTHFDPELKRKKKIAGDRNMFPMILKMRALLNICLFKDLGVNGAPIERVIKNAKGIRLISP